MKIYDSISLPSQTGFSFFIYGPSKIGKSTSILASAPLPIFHVICDREPSKAIKASGRQALSDPQNYKAAEHDGIEDLLDFFNTKQQNLQRFSTIFIDGFSNLCNMTVAEAIMKESWEARDKGKIDKNLMSQSKMTQENYGVLGRILMRFTDTILKYVARGKVVIFTSLVEEHPSFNRELVAAPLFMGKIYGDNFPGMFDVIGMVEARPYEEGKKYPLWMKHSDNLVYPPLINCDSPTATFMAGWTGVTPFGISKPLHIGKLIELSGKGLVDWKNDEIDHTVQEKEVKEVKEIKEEPKEKVKEEVKQDEFD